MVRLRSLGRYKDIIKTYTRCSRINVKNKKKDIGVFTSSLKKRLNRITINVKTTKYKGQLYSDVWIQVDYKKTMTLHGIVTQGSATNVKEWMTSYQVMYANENGGNFTAVMDSSGINAKVSLFANKTFNL